MRLKRVLARAISECWAVREQISGPRSGFRILLYHAIGTILPHDSYGISLRPELFDRQMAMLAAHERASIVALVEGHSSSALLRVALTFDDGYRDNLSVAAPILLKYKIPFTVFVTSFFVSHDHSSRYLSPADLRELADIPGASIGSHGATHTPLATCDDATLWNELHGSRCYIEDVLGKPIQAISYPHGSVNRRVIKAARKAGYTVGLCSRRDINNAGRDPLLLCRTEIVADDSERTFAQKLSGAWDWCKWRAEDPARC